MQSEKSNINHLKLCVSRLKNTTSLMILEKYLNYMSLQMYTNSVHWNISGQRGSSFLWTTLHDREIIARAGNIPVV